MKHIVRFFKLMISLLLWIPTVIFWVFFLFFFKIMCEACVKMGFTPNGANNVMIWNYQTVFAFYQTKKSRKGRTIDPLFLAILKSKEDQRAKDLKKLKRKK